MALKTANLPDGQEVFCLNPYEVDFSVHEIFSDGLFEHGIILPQDGTFLDVGANIGLFSIFLRRHCPDARLLAFEPIPDVYEALAGNMAKLKPFFAEAVQLALGASAGTVEFDYFPGVAALSTSKPDVGKTMADGIRSILQGASGSQDVRDLVEHTGAGERMAETGFMDDLFRVEKVPAPMDTLSNQLAIRGIDRVDLLKIDTEGAELDVIEGISEADWPKIAQMIVEVHLGDAVLDELSQQLAERGFVISVDRHPLAEGGAAVSQIYAVRPGNGPD